MCLSLYARAPRREKLESQWDSNGGPGDRNDYIAEGLVEYNGSLRRALILGVYVVPTALISLVVYLTNFA